MIDINSITKQTLEFSRSIYVNQFNDNCKYFLRRINPYTYKCDDLAKDIVLLSETEVSEKLNSIYEDLYEVAFYPYKSDENYTIIEVHYKIKSSFKRKYRKSIRRDEPMIFIKTQDIPPYHRNGKKMDLNETGINYNFARSLNLKDLSNLLKSSLTKEEKKNITIKSPYYLFDKKPYRIDVLVKNDISYHIKKVKSIGKNYGGLLWYVYSSDCNNINQNLTVFGNATESEACNFLYDWFKTGSRNIETKSIFHYIDTDGLKDGDVFEMPLTDNKKCYFQYICRDYCQEAYGTDVIVVFKKIYDKNYIANFAEITNDEISHIYHTTVGEGVKSFSWKKVGNCTPRNIDYVTFMSFDENYNDKKWMVWHIGDLDCKFVSKLPEKNTFMSDITDPLEISVEIMISSYKLKMNVVTANECCEDIISTMDIYQRITLFLNKYWERVKMSDVGEWLNFSSRIDYDVKNDAIGIFYNDYGYQSYVDFVTLLGLKNELGEKVYYDGDGYRQIYNNILKLQADDEMQFAYMFNYLKDLSLRHYWDFDKLFYDIMTQDPQTMDDWKQSKDGSQKVIKSL